MCCSTYPLKSIDWGYNTSHALCIQNKMDEYPPSLIFQWNRKKCYPSLLPLPLLPLCSLSSSPPAPPPFPPPPFQNTRRRKSSITRMAWIIICQYPRLEFLPSEFRGKDLYNLSQPLYGIIAPVAMCYRNHWRCPSKESRHWLWADYVLKETIATQTPWWVGQHLVPCILHNLVHGFLTQPRELTAANSGLRVDSKRKRGKTENMTWPKSKQKGTSKRPESWELLDHSEVCHFGDLCKS